MIERNRNAAGRLFNIAFGLCAIGDGLVRVLSLGHLHTRMTLNIARAQAKHAIARIKRKHAAAPDPRPLHEVCVRPGHPVTCAADEKVGCCYWRATPGSDKT